MDRYEARKAIVADLEEQGYLVKVEDYSHNVGTCYRCHNDVEPIISAQWFVKMKPLAEEAIAGGEGRGDQVRPRPLHQDLPQLDGERPRLVHLPAAVVGPSDSRLDLRRLRPHHRVPGGCLPVREVRQHPHRAGPRCAGYLVLLAPCGPSRPWAGRTRPPDLDYFYPTDVLVTGYDIIFFWVARMIFSGCEHTGKPPFHTVLIHGLVRDDKGRKMSKSLGNGIDPLEMIDKYGCDALRMNMVTGNSPGNDMRFYVERCEAMRNFANKLWNASRYVLMNLSEDFNACQLPEEAGDCRQVGALQAEHPHCRGHRESGAVRAGRGRPEGLRLHLGHLLRLVY